MRTSLASLQPIYSLTAQKSALPPSPVGFIGVIHAGYPQLATLVSPRHVALAAHYTRGIVGATITFAKSAVESESAEVARQVFQGAGDTLDFTIYELSHAVSIAPAKVATREQLTPAASYVASGIKNVLSGAPEAMLVPASFKALIGAMIVFRQNTGCTLENGDSGAGDFVMVDGEYRFVGPHYAITPIDWRTTIAAPFISTISALT